MSESFVRKIQPFTIGTKLSVPSVSKCPDFTESYLPSQALDNCKLRHNLNDHVSLFLGRAQVRSGNPRLVPQPPSPSSSSSSTTSSLSSTTTSLQTTTTTTTTTTTSQVNPGKHQQPSMAEEDHLNRNAISPTSAASRSIRKITISSSTEGNAPQADQGLGIPRLRFNPQVENNNNNNNITTTSNPQLPRIVGVSCENKPSSHFKVLLRKDSDEDKQNYSVRETRGKYQCVQQTPVFKALSPKRDLLKRESPLSESKDTPQGSKSTAIQNDHCFTQCNTLFNKEISQAEAWMKGKLRDLKDGCNIQRSPLTDWEEVSQTLQRDLKDFENTLIQLNQMGEQLMCKTNPTSDLVKKQLSQVRDQWQTLKQTAANQTKALGGARNLHEFNRKVDRLEAWIKDKQEEEQSLANLLGENIDKMQLTRRILDLKQDEQLYRSLHEEINHLALKLEKQGKTEGKNISTRKKHINKMWLKVQYLLKDFHENLQLALEVSSFYQQADNIMCAINNMRRNISASPCQASGGDGEIRDIASQIMMLDVTVSQLSNLHPSLAARVTQKQGEVKDCWALLQKAVRSEKPAPPSSQFAREDGDPATPSKEPQCSVGTPPHRLMGKEVKEEQNRLKGCAGGREPATTRAPTNSLDESSQNTGVSEVIQRPQTEAESRKQRAEEMRVAVAGATGTREDHPQLHTQLQKFTVSADKTLSWLKDNVAMATQICYTVGSNSSFEAAKRCQAVLEQDILCNRARIELVKKEGRGLVKAHHPGSAKIEEFLGQLEVLWDELKKQHQRNVVVLQASEELNFRAVTVLQALGGLETWLEAVETSIRESSVAGDPESMSLAEHESCLLERELSARGLQLQALRLEADTLRTQRHLHTELLPARIQEVDRKYQSVQCALTQQSSELQDTRMLTEFLERVELEEGSTLGQPLHSEIDSEPSLLALPSGGGNVPLLESIGNPVEELREAVEMLNDTARKRGRSICQDQAIQDLLSQHATVSVRVEQRQQRAAELAEQVQARESEMAVRCEPERSGLEALREEQQQLQAECAELMEEVEAMEGLTTRLEELCPERLHMLGAEVQATLGAWRELGNRMEENQDRLRQFGQLRDFFRNYLAMISWTEDTRSYIFSESAKHQAKENQVPVAELLDLQIEQKFKEFDELSAAAKKLIDSEHHLTKMIKERMEELRSMLGWILVHWRAQKAQWKKRKRRSETKVDEDAIYTEATVCSSAQQADPEGPNTCDSAPHDRPGMVEGSATAPPSGLEDQTAEVQNTESGYEVMSSLSLRTGSDTTDRPSAAAADEKPNSHLLVLKEPGCPSPRGTVNLILSFNNTGDSQLQVQEPESKQVDRVSEPIHRPAEPHSSACKSFWKRCQGLFGSLKRKKEIYRRSAEEDLLSVHMGLDGPSGQAQHCTEDQGYMTITGGRCGTKNGQKPEFPSMEGTLERKHRLQPGGKKAPCRTWNTYHAILYRQTLSFYIDRKDTLRSSASSLPLNLAGAECVPVPEYSRKPNCFSLRLRDGSEYLLSASSRFMMKKWMLRIHANTGSEDAVPSLPMFSSCSLQDDSVNTNQIPSSICYCRGICHCSTRDDVTSCLQTRTGRPKEIVLLNRDGSRLPFWHQGKATDVSLSGSTSRAGHDEDAFDPLGMASLSRHSPLTQDWLSGSNKRRSHSFTSATYQRIRPVRLPPSGGSQDSSSNYSVTLFIGDQPSMCNNTERPQRTAFGSGLERPLDLPLRNYASLPRPRNKSVFKKFFSKKE
ncbi:spectrin beta chain, non-erythrocytic 5 isoform X6 [Clupea harengus]|uniref:Spectrin beta chain, non-erythrocytic 5 isoform X6 n=1 Tax=Clupea harengus TaxID=7950 RepID=A0A6P8GIT2_CLUHA|nr:spectrin beta chain, non-erythrocytic 5 isoform X6 [Clupea harengus]